MRKPSFIRWYISVIFFFGTIYFLWWWLGIGYFLLFVVLPFWIWSLLTTPATSYAVLFKICKAIWQEDAKKERQYIEWGRKWNKYPILMTIGCSAVVVYMVWLVSVAYSLRHRH